MVRLSNLGSVFFAEPYEAIGRGKLNIENLPVYRDDLGAFATPTSDSTRTMLNLKTRQLLILINAYDGDVENLDVTIDFTIDLLKRFCFVSVSRGT